ncbi:hypothetical protein H681_06155 [Pseudomonas sp. ATCC 13867]|nr:hypothetical protein H681_06155 [Pseudomonas sp. ATCC 13867]
MPVPAQGMADTKEYMGGNGWLGGVAGCGTVSALRGADACRSERGDRSVQEEISVSVGTVCPLSLRERVGVRGKRWYGFPR